MLRIPQYFTPVGFIICTHFIDLLHFTTEDILIPALHFWNLDNLSASMYQTLRLNVDI